MFTGLIEDVGEIRQVATAGAGLRLTIATSLPLHEVGIGDSIAVDGACLTAEGFAAGAFIAVAARETVAKTTLGAARPGRRVHLERALRLGDRLDGHLVQGHVDGIGRVTESRDAGESWILWVSAPAEIGRFIAAKGSITLDGVSLTVNEVSGDRFRVNVVPHTARVTRLGALRSGDALNIEVDVLARYVDRLLSAERGGGLLDALRANGFG